MKEFKKEFDKMLERVSSDEPFCFTRFSDGEVTILRNKKLVLGKGFFIQGDIYGNSPYKVPHHTYPPEEQKEFDPEKDSFIHEKLKEAFLFKKKNYFKGIPGQSSFDKNKSWQFCIDLYGEEDHEHLTFSNVLINDNYRFFVKEMIPIFRTKKVVLVSNENSKFKNLTFGLVKHFPVGTNCMKNNYGLIEEMKTWIRDNNIENHLFLFSAASLSNFLGYELYKEFGNNQYMDVGSSLGLHLDLVGWRATRNYMHNFWQDPTDPAPHEVDIWN